MYQRRYLDRRDAGLTRPAVSMAAASPAEPAGPGPVELAVEAELAGLSAAQTQPSLAATALCMGRVLDGVPPTPKPPAAKVLTAVMDKLHKGSELRKPRLSMVRAMSEPPKPS